MGTNRKNTFFTTFGKQLELQRDPLLSGYENLGTKQKWLHCSNVGSTVIVNALTARSMYLIILAADVKICALEKRGKI